MLSLHYSKIFNVPIIVFPGRWNGGGCTRESLDWQWCSFTRLSRCHWWVFSGCCNCKTEGQYTSRQTGLVMNNFHPWTILSILTMYGVLIARYYLFLHCIILLVLVLFPFSAPMPVLAWCQVTLVELSRPSPTLPEILSGIGSTLVGVDTTVKELLQDLTFCDRVQARMDGIMFQRLEGTSNGNPIFALLKDYLSSLWGYNLYISPPFSCSFTSPHVSLSAIIFTCSLNLVKEKVGLLDCSGVASTTQEKGGHFLFFISKLFLWRLCFCTCIYSLQQSLWYTSRLFMKKKKRENNLIWKIMVRLLLVLNGEILMTNKYSVM